MANKKYSRKTSEQRKEEIKKLSAGALEKIESYTKSPENLKEYADFMAKFYHYSPRNNALIQDQFEGALAVASFKDWKEKGYSVRKGEKGIKILTYTPITRFKNDKGEIKTLRYATKEEKEKINKGEIKTHKVSAFSEGHVFDISQTNAPIEELPKIFPNKVFNFQIAEGNNAEHLKKGIEELAKELDIEIKDMKDSKFGYKELGNARGMYLENLDGKREILLNSRNTETQNLATSIHELAHAKLHHVGNENRKYDSPTKEFQAELTSYIVSKHYGMDTSEKAIPYIANWTKNGEKLEDKQKALESVHASAKQFIEIMDAAIIQERELEMEHVNVEYAEKFMDIQENYEKEYNEDINKELYGEENKDGLALYPKDKEEVLYCHMSGNPIADNEGYYYVEFWNDSVVLSEEAKETIYSKKEWAEFQSKHEESHHTVCKYQLDRDELTNDKPKQLKGEDIIYHFDGTDEPKKMGTVADIYNQYKNGGNISRQTLQDLVIIKDDNKEMFNMLMERSNLLKNPDIKDLQKVNDKKGLDKDNNLKSFKDGNEQSKIKQMAQYSQKLHER